MAGVVSMKVTRDHEKWISRLRGNGFSQKEIGDILGLSQQVVAYTLAQMKKRFKKKYAELWEGDDQ
jgi:DNA-directed RNA polymerase specialized sigma subunit